MASVPTLPDISKTIGPSVRHGDAAPVLYNGDHMKQAEFHRRYEAYPRGVKIELIGGIVYMAAAARRPHGRYHQKVGTLFDLYEAATPGVEGGIETTTILDEDNEPEPDCYLRVLPEYGGQSSTDEKDYITGSPELLAEISHSSVSIDLHAKRDNYQRAGVLEYVVVCVEERTVLWFDLKADRQLEPDEQGILRSGVFPGLWLDSAALIAQDTNGLVKTLQQGLASPEHAEFIKRLESQKKS